MAEGFYARHAKRWLDIAIAAALLAALAPLLALLALATRLALGPGVLFRQERAGLRGQPFTLLKFRSMRSPAHAGEPDAERLTRFGHLLRASALDEAPQLLNVLRGEMSLVGPRPLPMAYIPRYTPRQATRLRVRPGLAGLAQSRGRNAVPWAARLEWDARYAGGVTARGDLAAAIGTLRVLLLGRGVTAPGHATMPELPARPDDRIRKRPPRRARPETPARIAGAETRFQPADESRRAAAARGRFVTKGCIVACQLACFGHNIAISKL